MTPALSGDCTSGGLASASRACAYAFAHKVVLAHTQRILCKLALSHVLHLDSGGHLWQVLCDALHRNDCGILCAALEQGLRSCMPRLLSGLFGHASEPLLADAAAPALLALMHAFPDEFQSCGEQGCCCVNLDVASHG